MLIYLFVFACLVIKFDLFLKMYYMEVHVPPHHELPFFMFNVMSF